MPTINDLVKANEAEVNGFNTKLAAARAEIKVILDQAAANKRASLTPAEERRTVELFDSIDALKAAREVAQSRLTEVRVLAAEDAEIDRRSNEVNPAASMPRASRTASYGLAEHSNAMARGVSDSGLYVTDNVHAWRNEGGKIATVERSQGFGDNAIVREYDARAYDRDRHVIGQYGSLGQMTRALTTTGASAVVPAAWSNQIIDLARNKAACLRAGAQIVPMDRKTLTIGRLTADPTAAFRPEGASLGASDPTFDNITLTAKTISAADHLLVRWLVLGLSRCSNTGAARLLGGNPTAQ